MGNKYGSIKKLIDLWGSYEEETDQPDFSEFAEWMTVRLKEQPDLNHAAPKKRTKVESPEGLLLFKEMDEPLRFLEYAARMSRLHEFYVKKFFGDAKVNNRLEFLFLYTVEKRRGAKKTELIHAHMVDYTTGMDTIKRLVNGGLLEEMPDETDKRAKLLVLTDTGRYVLEHAGRRLAEEIQMFLACISMNKWKKTLAVLEEINDFHSGIYQAHNDKNPAELSNLMDSLKHLYK